MKQTRKNPKLTDRRGGWRLGAILTVALIGLTGIGALALRSSSGSSNKTPDAQVPQGQRWTVKQGPLKISLLAPGQIKAKENTAINCQVQGDVKIVWIINEGTMVKEGQKLVELEASGLEESLVRQRIQVATVQAQHFSAVEDVEIQKSKNESDILTAENRLFLAKLDLSKYQEGELEQLRLQKSAAIQLATAELERAQERLGGTKMLLGKGYVNSGEMKADELTVKKQELEKQKAETDLKVFEKYEVQRELNNLKNGVREAEESLEQVRRGAESALKNTETALASAKSRLELEEMQLKKLEDQKDATIIKAPRSGMVVYHQDGGRNSTPIQAGTQVRFRQTLIDLPDFSAWQIETRVHESMIRQVKVGQKGLVTIDALPDQLLEGEVERIGVLPDSSRWFQPDIKEYLVNLDLSTTTLPLKPGMSTKAELVLADLKDVLQVPVQAVFTVDDRAYVNKLTSGGPVRQQVELGMNNDRFVEVRSGLNAGDAVALTEEAQGEPVDVVDRPSGHKNGKLKNGVNVTPEATPEPEKQQAKAGEPKPKSEDRPTTGSQS